ncbi:MAG TPA: YebC/PmpR family DNA-binding transcriptional regulator [Longimicrobiales bacterium]|nr:YebC/PmpR family DNA-binding transcriptional regulator [Longimicrobiales bacterium]
MAGHSKWAQIKRKKAVNDNKRGQHFTKLIREITVAARAGGGDPGMNPRLRLAIDTAKAANMPAENIDRAVKKGTGELEGVDYQEIAYEGYGPAGVALYIETLTDNANRTVSDIRYVLSRNEGSMGTTGSVAWQFERKGQVYVDATRYDEDATLLAALEAGADDMRRDGDVFVITTELASFNAVQDGLRQAGIAFDEAELAMVARNTVEVAGASAQKLLKLLDALDDLDDVQKVHSNADIDEAAYAEAGA